MSTFAIRLFTSVQHNSTLVWRNSWQHARINAWPAVVLVVHRSIVTTSVVSNNNNQSNKQSIHRILSSMSKRKLDKKNKMTSMSINEQNVKKKQKLASLPPASATAVMAYVRVIQNGAHGFGQSVFLRTTSHAYLFGCPEGLTRLMGECRMPVSRLDHIFLTRSAWEKSGGLAGLALSLQASGQRTFCVHGPTNLGSIIDTVRPYQDQKMQIDCSIRTYLEEKFEDPVIAVEYIPLFSNSTNSEASKTDPEETEQALNQITEDDDLPGLTLKDAVKANQSNPPVTDANVSVCFLVQIKPKPPKINVKKCIQLKVPFGPMIGKLQNGETVTLNDGTLIKPEQVVEGGTIKPESFLVVDVPSEDFVDALESNDQLNGEAVLCTDLVIHYTDAHVYNGEAYQKWMRSFSESTRHLVLNSTSPYVAHSVGINKHQTTLNTLHPSVFPLLEYQKQVDATQSSLDDRVQRAEPGLCFWLRSKRGKRFERCFPESTPEESELNVSSKLDMAATPDDDTGLITDEVKAAIDHLQKHDFPVLTHTEPQYPEILMLGTSSAVPAKYRNVTGILCNISATSSCMFDCGESTYNQMYNLLGAVECDQRLANLKFIFLSHMHQDHYVGIFTVLVQRRLAMERLGVPYSAPYIMASAPLFGVCRLYSQMIQPLGHFCYQVHTRETDMKKLEDATVAAELKSIQQVKVDHPMMAYGVVIETLCGRKIVYSGDTRPCDALVEAGRGADLLIHEGTMEHGMMVGDEDAIRKRHSTVTEALTVGRSMGARLTLLTHFSGRYPKIPIITEDLLKPDVGIAHDNMRFSLHDVEKIHKLSPVLRTIFAAEQDSMVQRFSTRELRAEAEAEGLTVIERRDLGPGATSDSGPKDGQTEVA